MLYGVTDKGLVICGSEFDINKTLSVYITTTKDFNYLAEKYSELKTDKRAVHCSSSYIENRAKYSYVALVVPSKISSSKRNTIDIIIYKDRVIITSESDYGDKIIDEIFKNGERSGYSLNAFLWDFINTIVQKDIVFLSELENLLTLTEERIVSDDMKMANCKLYDIKKRLMGYCRFYADLLFIIDGMTEEFSNIKETDLMLFGQLSKKIERLKSEAELLRDYSFQIQDMYNTEISVRQNDIMKTLTIVTTIVLPLSLVTGWYGMNFKNMPELNTQYGYFVLVACSVVVILVSIWICRKKKYF